MTDLERRLVTILRRAWMELNAIRARDGVPYTRYDQMPYVDPVYFSGLVDECSALIEEASGDFAKPWPFAWELNDADSADFIETITNPPEPNDALKAAAIQYKAARREGDGT